MPNKAQPREVEGLEELFNSAGISSTKALRQGQKACAKLRCKSVTELCELASAVERQTFVAHVRRALSRSEEKALEEQLNQLVPTDEQIRSAVVSAASMFGTLWSAFRGKEKSTVSMLGDSSSEEEGIGSSEDGDAEEAELAARDTAAEEPTVPPPADADEDDAAEAVRSYLEQLAVPAEPATRATKQLLAMLASGGGGNEAWLSTLDEHHRARVRRAQKVMSPLKTRAHDDRRLDRESLDSFGAGRSGAISDTFNDAAGDVSAGGGPSTASIGSTGSVRRPSIRIAHEYHVFLSYRVASDKELAHRIYELLTSRGLKVWFDARCLETGQKWETGFADGLARSRIFVPLLSARALANFAALTPSSACDNVLLEHRLALELAACHQLSGIVPLLIGECDGTGGYGDFFDNGGCPDVHPDVVVESVEKKLSEHLKRMGFAVPSPPRAAIGVSEALRGIIGYQGAKVNGPATSAVELALTKLLEVITPPTFLYVVVQPPPRLLGQVRAQLQLNQQICSIEARIEDDDVKERLLADGRFPIVLRDAETFAVVESLRRSTTHCLVWCGTGYDEDACTPAAPLTLGDLARKLASLPETQRPRCAFVCLLYGAKRAAQCLFERAKLTRVVWAQIASPSTHEAVPYHEFVLRIVLPALEKAHTAERPGMPFSFERWLQTLGVQLRDTTHIRDVGCFGGASAKWSGGASSSSIVPWLRNDCKMPGQGVHTNLLRGSLLLPELSEMEVCAHDLPAICDLRSRLERGDHKRRLCVRSKQEDRHGRCRAVALEVCSHFLLANSEYKLVWRLSDEMSRHMLLSETLGNSASGRLGTYSPLLIWVDLVAPTSGGPVHVERGINEIRDSIDEIRRSFPLTSVVVTADAASSDHVKEFVKQDMISAQGHIRLRPLATPAGHDRQIYASAHHNEVRFIIYADETRTIKLQPFGNEWPVDAVQLRGALEEVMISVGGTHTLLAVYQDDDDAVLARVNQSDVGSLHQLRDRVLMGQVELALTESLRKLTAGALPKLTVQMDLTFFAKRYEESVMHLDKLTPHQRERFDQIGESSVRIDAPAGGGKTYLALHKLASLLEQDEPVPALFVARNAPLCFFVARWLAARLMKHLDDPLEFEDRLPRLWVMHQRDDGRLGAPQRCAATHDDRICFEDASPPEAFALAVVDEGHHLFSNDAMRTFVTPYVEMAARVMVLCDVSQSLGRDIQYPPGLTPVQLTEVVRCSKRIVQAASSFQIGGEAKLDTQCHHDSTGPPLKSFLFDLDASVSEAARDAKYTERLLEALQHVTTTYLGLELQDRVAILVPDTTFRDRLKPLVVAALHDGRSDRFGDPKRRFHLIDAREAASVLTSRDQTADGEALVFDTLANFDGLERLIVIAVDLDAPLDLDTDEVLETRSRLYRGLTRAHMMCAVVNVSVKGGWLEWLNTVKMREDAVFSREAEQARQNQDAASSIVNARLTEIEKTLQAALRSAAPRVGHDAPSTSADAPPVDALTSAAEQKEIRQIIDQAVRGGVTVQEATDAKLQVWLMRRDALRSAARERQLELPSGTEASILRRLDEQHELKPTDIPAALDMFKTSLDEQQREAAIKEHCHAVKGLTADEVKMVTARALTGASKVSAEIAVRDAAQALHEVGSSVRLAMQAKLQEHGQSIDDAVWREATAAIYENGGDVEECLGLTVRTRAQKVEVAAALAAEQTRRGPTFHATEHESEVLSAVLRGEPVETALRTCVEAFLKRQKSEQRRKTEQTVWDTDANRTVLLGRDKLAWSPIDLSALQETQPRYLKTKHTHPRRRPRLADDDLSAFDLMCQQYLKREAQSDLLEHHRRSSQHGVADGAVVELAAPLTPPLGKLRLQIIEAKDLLAKNKPVGLPAREDVFRIIDTNGDGVLSRVEIVTACRANPEVAKCLGLPQHIKPEDGSRDLFERIYQKMDVDGSKDVDLEDFKLFWSNHVDVKSSNPFIDVHLEQSYWRTSTVEQTRNPIWLDQHQDIPFHSFDALMHLLLFNSRGGQGADNYLGEVLLPVDALRGDEVHDLRLKVQTHDVPMTGYVHIIATVIDVDVQHPKYRELNSQPQKTTSHKDMHGNDVSFSLEHGKLIKYVNGTKSVGRSGSSGVVTALTIRQTGDKFSVHDQGGFGSTDFPSYIVEQLRTMASQAGVACSGIGRADIASAAGRMTTRQVEEALQSYGDNIERSANWLPNAPAGEAGEASGEEESEEVSEESAEEQQQEEEGDEVEGEQLMIACHNGDQETARLLLDRGAVVDQANHQGRTPLWTACWNGHEAVVQLLLDRGAAINLADFAGKTPLWLACRYGHEATAQLLLSRGAAVDVANEDGETPLWVACHFGNDVIAQFLMERGAALDHVVNGGVTPLHVASKRGHVEVVRKLLLAGVNRGQKTVSGLTALDLARTKGHEAVTALLTSPQRAKLVEEGNGLYATI